MCALRTFSAIYIHNTRQRTHFHRESLLLLLSSQVRNVFHVSANFHRSFYGKHTKIDGEMFTQEMNINFSQNAKVILHPWRLFPARIHSIACRRSSQSIERVATNFMTEVKSSGEFENSISLLADIFTHYIECHQIFSGKLWETNQSCHENWSNNNLRIDLSFPCQKDITEENIFESSNHMVRMRVIDRWHRIAKLIAQQQFEQWLHAALVIIR